MGKLDTSKWEKVAITELFEIKSGKRLTKENWGDPIYNYIGSSSINNGITGKCNQWNYEDCITINYNGSVGFAFLQKGKFFLSDDVKALTPLYKRSDLINLFICTVLTKTMTKKYSYGKKLSSTRLSKESIYLPHKDGKIDWEWIEAHMQELHSKLPKRREFVKPTGKKYDTSKWEKFRLVDLFDFKKGSGKITKSGAYKLVSASASNRGISGLSETFDFENCFSFSSVGAPGYCFWHNYKFKAANNMGVLIPKFKYTNNTCLFLETVLTKSLIPKYSYGKPLSLSRIKLESVYLPAKNGQPDFEYMDQLMKSLCAQ